MTMGTVEHKYENKNRLLYALSSSTKLNEEGERGVSMNLSGNWRWIANEKTGLFLCLLGSETWD